MRKSFLFFCFSVFLFLGFFVYPSFAMGGTPPEPEMNINIPSNKNNPVEITIDKIKSIDSLEGQKVAVKGKFDGWKNINEPTPFSRRDWILTDDTGSVFIHGPYPVDCDPLKQETINKNIKIEGTIKSKIVSDFGVVKRVVYIEVKREK